MNSKYKKAEQQKQQIAFAILIAVVVLVLYLIFDGNAFLQNYGIPIALGVLGVGLFFPQWLQPVLYVWMKLAQGIGFVSNRLLLGVVFYGILTPIALLRRAFSRKTPPADTYWSKEKKVFDKESMRYKF